MYTRIRSPILRSDDRLLSISPPNSCGTNKGLKVTRRKLGNGTESRRDSCLESLPELEVSYLLYTVYFVLMK